MKIFHVSDLHLGTAFKSGVYTKTQRDECRMRLWEAFETFLKLCVSEAPEVVLMTGDMLEGDYISANEAAHFFKLISDCTNVNFFMIMGNHDRLSFEELYFGLNIPDNIHIFKSDKIEAFELEGTALRVYGASWIFKSYDSAPKIEGIVLDDNYVNICMLHSDIYSNTGYMYADLSELKNAGFEYVALGHIHKPMIDMPVSYAGTLEAHSFADSFGGYNEIVIDDGKVSVKRIECGLKDYVSADVDVSGLDFSGIISAVKATVGDEKNLYRIRLLGDVDCDIDMEDLRLHVLRSAYYVELEDCTRKIADVMSGSFMRNFNSELDTLAISDERKQNILELAARAVMEVKNEN